MVIQVSAGSRHSLALSRNGTLYGFGSGERGQLGFGEAQRDGKDMLLPVEVPLASKGLPLFVVAVGMHSVAVCQATPTREFQLAGEGLVCPPGSLAPSETPTPSPGTPCAQTVDVILCAPLWGWILFLHMRPYNFTVKITT